MKIGDVVIFVGIKIFVVLLVVNCDLCCWDNLNELVVGCKKVVEYVGFGCGKYVCVGVLFVCVEVCVIMEKFLVMIFWIEFDFDKYLNGVVDFNYELSFIICGFDWMYIKLVFVESFVVLEKKVVVFVGKMIWMIVDSWIGDLFVNDGVCVVFDWYFFGMVGDL